jgi:hypothetical protein
MRTGFIGKNLKERENIEDLVVDELITINGLNVLLTVHHSVFRHLDTNQTQNNTMTQNTQNGTYIAVKRKK